MKTLFTVAGVAVLLLSAAGSRAELPMMPGPAFSHEASVLQHPELYSSIDEIEGNVQFVDFTLRIIAIKDSMGHILEIHVRPDTPITDINRGSLQLSDLAENETVHIYFETTDMTARQIDRVTRGFWGALLFAS